MSAKVVVDLPALAERVKAIAKTYKNSNNANNSNSVDTQNILKGFVGSLIMTALAEEESYWGRAGIRMVSHSDYESCFAKLRSGSKVLGSGEFGQFMSLRANSCIRGLPAGLKKVGIKTEYLKDYYHPNQSPEGVRDAFLIAKKAASLGIGPEMYDLFITKDAKGKVLIVKVSQIINGKTWEDTEWDSPQQQHAAAIKLRAAIQKMNSAGIIHHDLAPRNVMVDKSGRVYIIDYDLAKFVKNEEYGLIHEFDDSFPGEYEPVGVATHDGTNYVYKKLVEEGSIKETQSDGRRAKTRKVSRV